MSKNTLRRRQLLRGIVSAGVVLPLLPSLQLSAAPPKNPKRLVLMFSANGTIPEEWAPSGTETNFQFKQILKPLEPYKKKVMVIEGLGMDQLKGPGDAHQKGMGHLYTGSVLLPGQTKGGCDTCAAVSWAGNQSIDQYVADFLLAQAKKEGRQVPIRSLDLGVQVKNSNIWTRMCYRGSGLPIPPKNDPYEVYKDLFGSLAQNQQKLDEIRLRRKSVLDGVVSDLVSLQNQLGGNDLQRLNEHLDNIREIERQLDNTANGTNPSCKPTPQGSAVPFMDNKNFPKIGQLQMDLIAMALTCGMTDVASLQWGSAVSNVAFNWLNIFDGHHSISHLNDTDGSARNNLIKINNWYAQQFAYLTGKLQDLKDPDGQSVLDNTLLVWGNELGKGNSHTLKGIPFVLAGNLDGQLRTGRYLKFSNKPHNHLLVSIAQLMGSTIDTFGHSSFKGNLTGLT